MLKKIQIKTTYQKAVETVRDESGQLSALAWTVGSAVVVALIIVGAMVYAPDTAKSMWESATQWIRGEFGF